jgi:predicted amidohydrolase
MEGKIGTLSPGAHGDAVVLDLQEGAFDFQDSRGVARMGNLRLEPVTVVKAGRLHSHAA